jgi:chemotaxis protein MotB
VRGQGPSAYRWKIASGFCAVVTFTVVVGYYVPLYREAARLRTEQAALLAAKTKAGADLDGLRAELERVRSEGERLRRDVDAPKTSATRVKQRIEKLTLVLTSQFGRLVQAKMLVVSSADDRMSVALAVPALFGGGPVRVTPNGRSLLCELTRTILDEYRGQLRVSGYYGAEKLTDPSLSARYASPWHLSAARAASAAEVLASDCAAPPERLLVVGYGPRAAGPLGENVALELIFRPED